MPVYGQNSAVDSLKRELGKHKEEDIKRLIILVELVKGIGSNDLQECEKLLSEAQKIRNILKNNYSIVKYYEGQINFDRFNDSHQEAIANSDKALTICKEENYKTEYYEILLLKALSLVRGDAIKETEKLLNEVKANNNYLSKISRSKMYAGFGLFYVEQGKFDLSINNLTDAIKLAYELNNKVLVAKYLAILFIPYYKKRDFKQAIEQCIKAEKVLLAEGDTISASATKMNLSHIYSELKEYDKVVQSNLEIVAVEEKFGLQKTSTYINLANGYSDLKKYDKSEYYLLKAIDIGKKQQDIIGENIAKANLGILYTDNLSKHKEAIKLLSESLEMMKDNDPSVYGIALLKLADAYLHDNNYDKAKGYSKQAIAFNKMHESKEALRESYITQFLINLKLSTLNKVRQDELKENFDLVTNLSDTLAREKYTQEIADKLTKYETQKKEDSIVIITKETKLLKAEKEVQQNKTYLLLAVASLLLVIGVLLFYRKNQKEKQLQKDKELAEQRTIAVEQAKENEKLQVELEAKQQNNVELEERNQRIGSLLHGSKILYYRFLNK